MLMQVHEESHSRLFFACSWTSLLWSKVKSWLRLCRGMATISSAARGLNIKGKTLLLGWKGSPSALLSTWYGKKGIKEFLKTPAHWLNLFFWRFHVLFYTTLHFHEHNHPQISVSWPYWVVVMYCGMLSSLRFAVHIVTASELIVLVVAASLKVLLCCMMLMSVTPCNLWCPKHFLCVSYFI